MNFLTNYASRIHERASYSDNAAIVDYLKETLGQVSRDIQAIVGRSPYKPAIPNKPDIVIHNDNNALKPTNGNHLDNNNSLTCNNSQNNHIHDPQTQEMFQQFMAFMKMTKSGTLINGQSNSQQQQQQQQSATQNSTKVINNDNNNVNSD